MVEAFPVHVGHLCGEPAVPAAGKETAEVGDNGAKTHDEHHVETPQSVQREEAAGVFLSCNISSCQIIPSILTLAM